MELRPTGKKSNMKKRKVNTTILNVISSVTLQLSLTAVNFIVPRFILEYFGSSTNGLVSSITQFLSYISLLEGGINGVLIASLYKPLREHDTKKISQIAKTATKFFRKITLIFIFYVLLLATIYPLFIQTDHNYIYSLLLVLVLSITTIIQYTFSFTARAILTADKKLYIVAFTQVFINLLSIVAAFVSLKIYPEIHILKLATGSLYVIQPLVYNHFLKKYYILDKKAETDNTLLKNRWDGFAVNTAAFIHNCTDIVLLGIFTDLKTVSIYSTYALVTTGLRCIIQSIANGINPSIGHIYAEGNKEKINSKFNNYEFIMTNLIFTLFSVAGLLIVPFVMIYTNGIVDTNYNQPLFAVLLLLSEGTYLIKEPHVGLAYSANKYKELTKPCFIEAGINILLSIILVNFLGLIGVAIGTFVAMIFRMCYHIYFTKKLINRKQSIFYKRLAIYTIGLAIGILLCGLLIGPADNTIKSWLFCAISYTCIFTIIYTLISFICYKQDTKNLLKYLKHKS